MSVDPAAASEEALQDALDRLQQLVLEARRLPMSERIRLDPEAARAATAHVRAAAATLLAEEARASERPLTDGLQAWERLVSEAPAMPLSRDVRLDLGAALVALSDLDMAVATRGRTDAPDPAISAAVQVFEAIDRLDDLVHRAAVVPLTGQVRIDPDAFLAVVSDLRTCLGIVLADEARRSHRPMTDHVVTLERLVAEAPELPIGRKVRLERTSVYEVLDRFRAELPEAVRRSFR